MTKSLSIEPGLSKVIDLLTSSELRIVNLGLELFAETIAAHGAVVVHVDWQPPAGGDDALINMLNALDDR